MFDALSNVSSTVAVSAASKLLNLLFEELKQSTKSRKNKSSVASVEVLPEKVLRSYSERLEANDLAIQLYKEILEKRKSESLELSEEEVHELTRDLSRAIKIRLIEEGKVDEKRGRQVLEHLRNTVP